MQRVATVDSAEGDAHDEFLALHAFQREGSGRQDFILDDEIDAFVRRAGERGVDVILVIDACHSGTAFRSVDQRVKPRYRFSNAKVDGDLLEGLDDDDLFAGLDAETADADAALPENLFSFGAVIDGNLVPEIPLPDAHGRAVPRGAMSYFFARGLRGAADSDGDGAIQFDELKQYVLWNISVETRGGANPERGRVGFEPERGPVPAPKRRAGRRAKVRTTRAACGSWRGRFVDTATRRRRSRRSLRWPRHRLGHSDRRGRQWYRHRGRAQHRCGQAAECHRQGASPHASRDAR